MRTKQHYRAPQDRSAWTPTLREVGLGTLTHLVADQRPLSWKRSTAIRELESASTVSMLVYAFALASHRFPVGKHKDSISINLEGTEVAMPHDLLHRLAAPPPFCCLCSPATVGSDCQTATSSKPMAINLSFLTFPTAPYFLPVCGDYYEHGSVI